MSGKSRRRKHSPLGGRLDYVRKQFPDYTGSCDVPDCGHEHTADRALTWYSEDGTPFTVLIKLCREHADVSFEELQRLLPKLVEVFGDNEGVGYMDLRETDES